MNDHRIVPHTSRNADTHALAWELIDDGTTDDFLDACERAIAMKPVLSAFIREWDAQTDPPEPDPWYDGAPIPDDVDDLDAEPQLPKIFEQTGEMERRWTNALHRAAWELEGSCEVRYRINRALVGSRSRPGIVYSIVQDTCSCAAGRKGLPCWHLAAVKLHDLSEQQRALDAA